MKQTAFDEIYAKYCGNPGVSPELKPLLAALSRNLLWRPADLSNLRQSIISVLEFLVTPQGRTDENCRAVDMFLCIGIPEQQRWDDLPAGFVDVLDDMGGSLHDTISAPDVAAMCDSTPEQLLARAVRLQA